MKMYRALVFLFLIYVLKPGLPVIGQTDEKSIVCFIENKGQIYDEFNQPRPDILSIGVSQASQLLISASGYSHQLNKIQVRKNEKAESDDEDSTLIDSVHFSRVDLSWLNANGNVKFEKLNVKTRRHNYYNLPHQPEGITDVREYESIRLKGIYPGIDVHFYDAEGLFEHDYEIAPGADYRDIQIKISGTTPRLNSAGELVLTTPLGTITESSPKVFQNGEELQSKWIQIDGNVWGFEVPDANPELAMVIDPVSRVWGTYYGGSNLDEIYYCKMDQWGNLYTSGGSSSTTNIATTGTEQVNLSWGKDAVFARFDEDGNHIWGTYIGGNGNEESWGLDFDEDGNIYVIGRTESTNNISTPGSHQEDHGDGGSVFDGFVVKFNPDGVRIWGTYYGGDDFDRCRFCHVSSDSNLYVTGVTKSFNNISTVGSHQENYSGGAAAFGDDAMLIKFNLDGERIWATYYGGTEWEEGYSCDSDSESNIYLFGHAQSNNNISTAAGFQPIHGGGTWDSYLVKFNSNGLRQWGTYIGGNSQDLSWTCSINDSDEIFITGRTESPNNIASPGVHQEVPGGDFDAYLMKFATDGTREWGTYLGGPQYDRGFGCVGLINGKVLLAGHTESNSGISTPESHQENFGGGIDAFLSLFSGNGELEWSTYYGGSNDDVGRSATSYNGAYYMAGWTESNNNISTTGSHQEIYGGQQDGFIVKFSECENTYNNIEVMSCDSFVAPDDLVYFESGEYTAILPNSSGCDSIISIDLTISNVLEFEQEIHLCQDETFELPDGTIVSTDGVHSIYYDSDSNCDSIVEYTFTFHDDFSLYIESTQCANVPVYDHLGNEITENGIYVLEYLSIYGCDSTITLDLTFEPVFETTIDTSFCTGGIIDTPQGPITEGGNYTYSHISSNGCDSIIHLNVELISPPQAAFSTSPELPTDVYNNTIQFFDQSIGADSIAWDFFDFGTSTQPNPIISYGQFAGQYSACLTAFSDNGCNDQYCLNFNILEDFAVYIPNSFSPNGDGINDLFFVDGIRINPDNFMLRIFNRYGEVIFETSDLYEKWDGGGPRRTHYVQNEVYVYQVYVGALDSSDRKEITGHITIIR